MGFEEGGPQGNKHESDVSQALSYLFCATLIDGIRQGSGQYVEVDFEALSSTFRSFELELYYFSYVPEMGASAGNSVTPLDCSDSKASAVW